MNLPPENALVILVNLLKRAPLTDAEAVGAQFAINVLETANKELKEFQTSKEKKE